MALQISFTIQKSNQTFTNLYLMVESVTIKKVPQGEYAIIRCVFYVSQSARQNGNSPIGGFSLDVNCTGAKYTTFFKTPTDDVTLDINKTLQKAAYKFLKTLNPVTVAADRDYFKGLYLDIKNNATDIDNV